MATAGPLDDSPRLHTSQNWERLKCHPRGQESSVIGMALSSQKPTPHKYWGLLMHQLITGPKMARNNKSNTTRTEHPWLLVLRVNIKATFLFKLVPSQWTSILQSPHHGNVSILLMFTPLGFLHLLNVCKRSVVCHCWLVTEQGKHKWVMAMASLDTAVYIRLWQ